jgi:hypothetical protein
MSGNNFSISNAPSTSRTAYGATVLERVLLGIINAHTSRETDGQQAERLEAALLALVGPARQDKCEMEKALLFMVRQRQKNVCDFEMGAVPTRPNRTLGALSSISELASRAAREVIGCSDANETLTTARVLCCNYRKWVKAHSGEYDQVREALETEAVQRACDELAEWDVPTSI